MKNWQFVLSANLNHPMRNTMTIEDCEIMNEADEELEQVLWENRGKTPINPEDCNDEYAI